MAYIKFRDAKNLIKGSVIPQGDNIVMLKFPKEKVVDTSGFNLYLDEKGEIDIGGSKYLSYTTIYRNDEETDKYNGYQLSNDGSVYSAPIPKISFSTSDGGTLSGNLTQEAENYEDLIIPTPVPDENYEFSQWVPEIPKSGKITASATYTASFIYVQTLAEIKEQKIKEMNAAQQEIIQNGVEVTLSDGTIERFTLKDQDQTSLMGLQTEVAKGNDQIPWHTEDQSEHCKYYSNADMQLILTAAMGFVTYEVTWFRDLRIYINSMETKEEVEAVTYETPIPYEYQSQPLRDMLAMMNV